MRVEFENAKEAYRLARKETPKHIPLVVGLYALSIKERELGKVARTSYFFLRHMDDLLDGDIETGINPLDYALNLRNQIDSGHYTGEPKIGLLAEYSVKTLQRRGKRRR